MDTIAKIRAMLGCQADASTTHVATQLAARASISVPTAQSILASRPVTYATAERIIDLLRADGHDVGLSDVQALCGGAA